MKKKNNLKTLARENLKKNMSSDFSSSNIAIELCNVSKKYQIHHEKPTLVEKFINRKNETFWALRDINLRVLKGEKIGIIGPNGCGKTTLLKVLNKITTPTQGTIQTNGRVVSLIGLTTGFHTDLTGYQNIFFSSMILGVSKNVVKEKLDEIIDFAGLKQFIDIPMYTYSVGMCMRLGFSIAVHAKPDILLIDEEFVVGDLDFQRKCFQKMDQLYHEGKTIIIVSHLLEYITKICTKIITMERGEIVRIQNVEKS